MSKEVIINGKKCKLEINIDQESLQVFIDNGDKKEPTHVCYWHIEEVEEDVNVCISMINAVHLFHTNPQELVDRLKSVGA